MKYFHVYLFLALLVPFLTYAEQLAGSESVTVDVTFTVEKYVGINVTKSAWNETTGSWMASSAPGNNEYITTLGDITGDLAAGTGEKQSAEPIAVTVEANNAFEIMEPVFEVFFEGSDIPVTGFTVEFWEVQATEDFWLFKNPVNGGTVHTGNTGNQYFNLTGFFFIKLVNLDLNSPAGEYRIKTKLNVVTR